MIYIKFDQKIKKNPKNLNFGLLRFFLGFFKNLKKPRFFSKPFSSPGSSTKRSPVAYTENHNYF